MSWEWRRGLKAKIIHEKVWWLETAEGKYSVLWDQHHYVNLGGNLGGLLQDLTWEEMHRRLTESLGRGFNPAWDAFADYASIAMGGEQLTLDFDA